MASAAVCLAAAASPRHFPSSPLLSPPLLRHNRRKLTPSPPPRLRRPLSLPPIGSSFRDRIRPVDAVETDLLPSDVRKRAMDAVDSYGRRVTIGDVAGRAGLKLNEAERALQALTADSGGFLEVSDEGDVLYVFPRDYRAKLAAKSFRMKAEPVIAKIKAGAEYLIRVAFGTALVTSIMLVYTAIIVLLRSEDDNRERRRGRSYSPGFSVYMSPTDLFWFWDPYYHRRRQTRTDEGMNFVESVFSFVFGDGNPNQGLEEERWKVIGQYISSNGGVVAAEELAPYLDVPSGSEKLEEESYILPVLLRFDGHAEVDELGNILYRFPSLQRTASAQWTGRREYVGRRWAEWVDGVEKFFKERKWMFSKTKASERAMVAGLGAFNLVGVIVLGAMLKNTTIAREGFISFVAYILPLLQVYAASFFAIPSFRWLLLRKRNEEIEKRNQAREQRARALEIPSAALRQKLLCARDLSRKTVVSSDKIVYNTNKDLDEQDYEVREWERKFKERNV